MRENVTVIFKSFERQKMAKRLYENLQKYYPGVRVVIADDSAENLTGDVRDFLEEFQNTDRYKIMLCHRPDSFVFGDASDYWKIDLVISGHDHGGQVVIPFKGGLYGGDQGWFPPYVHGLYRTGRIRLFVTSGLSSEKQKLPRWNNRPEIAVLNVH